MREDGKDGRGCGVRGERGGVKRGVGWEGFGMWVVICSSGWLFGSLFCIAGVISLRMSPKCTSHIIG